MDTYDLKQALELCEETLGVQVIKLIGCGNFGCVYLTADPSKVLKITPQLNEFIFAKFLLENNNNIHDQFPIIYDVWDLKSCYPQTQFYAILRENIEDVDGQFLRSEWFDEVTADLEFLCERYYDINGEISSGKIFEFSAEILEKSPGNLQEELEFEKLIEFYAWCFEHGILITDGLFINFGQRSSDTSLVLRDFGGVHLLRNKNPFPREMFRWGRFTWDINKANELIRNRGHSEPFLVNVDDFYSSISWGLIRINKEYALTSANFTKPIIFGWVKVEKSWYRILIDGHHRLYGAKQRNIKILPAYFLTKEENKKVMTGL